MQCKLTRYLEKRDEPHCYQNYLFSVCNIQICDNFVDEGDSNGWRPSS